MGILRIVEKSLSCLTQNRGFSTVRPDLNTSVLVVILGWIMAPNPIRAHEEGAALQKMCFFY